MLVEAKANVLELTGGDLAATSPVSLAAIRSALNEARERLGATGDVEAWTGPYYQLANRLAWTMWLRTHDVDAVFAHVLFEHDHSHRAASADELTAAVHAAHAMLGVPDRAIAGWATTVVLPGTGCPRRPRRAAPTVGAGPERHDQRAIGITEPVDHPLHERLARVSGARPRTVSSVAVASYHDRSRDRVDASTPVIAGIRSTRILRSSARLAKRDGCVRRK